VREAKGDARGGEAPSSVQVEGFSVLVTIQEGFQIPVAEEEASLQEPMSSFPGQLLNPSDDVVVDPITAEVIDELVVVHISCYFLGGHLFPYCCWIHFLCCESCLHFPCVIGH
jgi:hypothetical protein